MISYKRLACFLAKVIQDFSIQNILKIVEKKIITTINSVINKGRVR